MAYGPPMTPDTDEHLGWLSGRWLSPGLGRMLGRMLVQMAPATTTNRVPTKRELRRFTTPDGP
jgi:hypothetical protein